MTARLDQDLARWEAGELTLDGLRRLHPEEDVAGLTAMHQQLSALAAEPTPDPARAWAALAPHLAVSPMGAAHRRPRRPRRAVVAAIIASALAVPTVSYAAAPDAVRSVVREVRDLLPGGTDDDPVLNRTDVTDAPPATAVDTDDEVPVGTTGTGTLPSPGSPTLQTTEADDTSDDEPSDSEAPDSEPDDMESLPEGQPQTDGADGGRDDPDAETQDAAVRAEAEPDGDAAGSAGLASLADDDAAGESSDQLTDD